jgi:crossover junction endodeoxyribonuclease RuvC
LGVDPGLRVTGYGLVEQSQQNYKMLECGIITTDSSNSLILRLNEIVTGLSEIIDQFKPDHASVEQIFSAVNVKTALLLGHVRGAILSELSKHEIHVFEYSPLEIKRAVVGYGRAEKQQVSEMVQLLLQLKQSVTPFDASDALAAAICHGNNVAMIDMENG